jgi:dynein light chain LC8-type
LWYLLSIDHSALTHTNMKGKHNNTTNKLHPQISNMAERKPNVKFADMTEEMQNDAVESATKAIAAAPQDEGEISRAIKQDFDRKHNPTWQCIVGRNFAGDVVHEGKHFIYFYLGQLAILLWKTV